MDKFEPNSKNKIKRSPHRGVYDKKTIYKILDDGFVCHAGFIHENQPFVIPMSYGRKSNSLYLHGASSSRFMKINEKENNICITVTHIDGLVLSRAAFDHSVNYRSVVVLGKARKIEEFGRKLLALEAISEHIIPGRWREVRKPSDTEIKATTILEVEIEQASAKIRSGPPDDQEDDYKLNIWAGIVPLSLTSTFPLKDPLLNENIEPTKAVLNFYMKFFE